MWPPAAASGGAPYVVWHVCSTHTVVRVVLRHLKWCKMVMFRQPRQAPRTSWGSQAFSLHIANTAGTCQEPPWQHPSWGFLFLRTKPGSLVVSLGLGWESWKKGKRILTTILKTLLVCKRAKFHVPCCYTASYFPVRKQASFQLPISYAYFWFSFTSLLSSCCQSLFCSSHVHQAQL